MPKEGFLTEEFLVTDVLIMAFCFSCSGKSLYIRRLYQKLKHSTKKPSVLKCIRLIEPNVDENVIIQSLFNNPDWKALAVFHFDITSSVRILLFLLVI